MFTEVATKAEATTFCLKLEISIKNSENGHILVTGQKFSCDVKIPASYGSHAARVRRAENLALQQYAVKLEQDIHTNAILARRLKNVDWSLFSKTTSVKEL